jgi:transcriptional regulator with XRE-family HTH domain
LGLLTPEQIRQAIERLGVSQKEVAQSLGIAEATLSRWLNEIQIQTRSLDVLLRLYFGLPAVRAALHAGSMRSLGLFDSGRPVMQ